MKHTTLLLSAAMLLAAAGSAQSAELRMSWWGGDSRHTATQEALKVCGEKYGHTVKPEFTGWKGHLEKVTTQIAGGTEPDIMQINWPWLPLFSKSGDGFEDLGQHSDIIKLDNWSEPQLASTTVNGKINGLPLSTTGRVFFFNKTTFDKAGIPVPTNWDELLAAGHAFKDKLGEDYYPLNMIQETAALIVSLSVTQETGKDLVDPETVTVAWTAEELTKGIQFYAELVKKGVVKPQKEVAAAGNVALHESPDWADGRIAGSYEWDSTYFKYSDPLQEGQELVSVPMLTSADTVTQGIYRKPSMMFSISKNSQNKKAAAEIVNCLLNEEEGIKALGTTRGLPASKAAATLLSEAGSIKPEIAAANKIIMESTGPNVSPLNEHPDVRKVFLDTLEEFSYQQIDASAAASQIIDGINETLADFR